MLKERERPANSSVKAAEWTTPTRNCLQAVNLMLTMFEKGEFHAHLVPSVIKAIEIVNLIDAESGSLNLIFSVKTLEISIGIFIFQMLAM